MSLKQPLYALLIADDNQMRLNTITGVKKISIREGHRDYHPGPMMICDHVRTFAVMVDIVEVKHLLLKEVSQEELEADGFTDHEDMLKGLRPFYPNITMESPITVIKWENVRGYWTTSDGIELFKALR